MANPDLIRFILEAQKRNFTDGKIKEALLSILPENQAVEIGIDYVDGVPEQIVIKKKDGFFFSWNDKKGTWEDFPSTHYALGHLFPEDELKVDEGRRLVLNMKAPPEIGTN